MQVSLNTLGCRLNQCETDAIERLLIAAGHDVVDSDAGPDIHIINTCSITHDADGDARKLVRRLRRSNPTGRIVLTGCYATAALQQGQPLDGVAMVVDNTHKGQLVELLARLDSTPHPHAGDVQASASPDEAWGAAAKLPESFMPPHWPSHRARAYLKIQDGCDYKCAFCIVPFLRGRSRSLSPETIVRHLRELVAEGVPEVVITGVHLGTYGRDLAPRLTLSALVERMLPHLGATRLRLSSLDPHEVDDHLIALMGAHPDRLCRHLHLPIQSGDDGVLKHMRRAHTTAQLQRLAAQLTTAVPGIALGLDVIVGFPGETRAAFANTHALLTSLPSVAYAHVFRWSVRQGTAAATMTDHVSHPEKLSRSQRLRALSGRLAQNFLRSQTNQLLDAVILRHRDKKNHRLVALTDNYLRVNLDGDDSLFARRVTLRIDPSKTPNATRVRV